ARGRAAGAGPPVSSALLARRGMALPGRRARRLDPVLSRAPAARAARALAMPGGRGRHARVVPEDPAARGRPRDRERVPPEEPSPQAAAVRVELRALSQVLLPAPV